MSSAQVEIQLIAVLVAVACAIPGTFLVLRRLAMISDAISHSILPGIVLGFFITQDLNSPLLIGLAALTGVLTVALVEAVQRTGLVKEDTAIGLVFPTLFSIGVILIARYANDVHLDVDAVLLGELAFAPFDRLMVGEADWGPKSLWVVGTILIIIVVALMGGDIGDFLGAASGGGGLTAPAPSQPSTGGLVDNSDRNAEVVSATLYDTEQYWGKTFPQEYNRRYQAPVLVLFTGQTSSGCGHASSATGPFYCPADNKVYIDLSFADLLRRRFKAPGEFALAYVVAHEVGHHVQNQLGYSQQVSQARRRMREKDANAMSVRLELQADYLAGVWAHYADNYSDLLSEEEWRQAIQAASAIGDDAIQKQSQGRVVPDSFTHGTSEQRVRYFYAGYQSGDASKKALDYFFTAQDL